MGGLRGDIRSDVVHRKLVAMGGPGWSARPGAHVCAGLFRSESGHGRSLCQAVTRMAPFVGQALLICGGSGQRAESFAL